MTNFSTTPPFSLKVYNEKKIIPKKVDIYNWIDSLSIAMRKEKDKSKKQKMKIIIDEFKTLVNLL